MYALFAVLGGAALCVTLGLWYRAAIVLFCVGFTYAHLIDRTNYLNHYYLVSLLSALMMVLPLHRAGSIDAWRRPDLGAATAPAWAVWILRVQLGVVYVFGAVAKLNPDWLLHAQPLRIWLGANLDLPLLGPWLEQPWVAYACSYAGLLFDATVVPLLLWRPTRAPAYAAVLVFHVLTALLFPIGMFPWIMMALTPIFFAPDWPRRWLVRPTPARPATPAVAPPLSLRRGVGAALLGAYALVQVGVPLRHLLYPSDVYWSEDGFRFSWQIMVMEKYGRATFRADDPTTGETWRVNPADFLTPLQVRMMATQPDMIRSFAQSVAADFPARGHARMEVRGDVFASLNGRPHQRLVDPRVDLARLSSAPTDAWLTPLTLKGGDVMIARMLPLIAAVTFLGVAFGWRAWFHRRRFGHSGLMLFRSGHWAQHLREAMLLVLAALMGGQAVLYALDPEWLAAFAPVTLPVHPGWVALGALLVLGGIGLIVEAQLDLGASWRVGFDEGARPGLVTKGLYRFSRNPIYVALFVGLAGFVILLPTWLSLTVLVASVAGIRNQVREEERFLLRMYGEAFMAYARRVGRFLPGLGTLTA